MDGLTAITRRVAQIDAQIARLAPPPPPGTPQGAAFAVALDRAVSVGASGAPTATTAPTAPVTPPELAGYGNGRFPATALTGIGAGHRLWAPAAAAFRQMSVAAARDGVTLQVNDSYRSYADQVDVARRKGLYSRGGLAAAPGTSDHGWGRSLDLGLDPAGQRWMRAHAPRFGFTENVPREPWHWTFTTG